VFPKSVLMIARVWMGDAATERSDAAWVRIEPLMAAGEQDEEGKEQESARSLALSDYTAPGACGQTRIVLQSRRPRPELAEMGVTKCSMPW
jgi:hypothetical protein